MNNNQLNNVIFIRQPAKPTIIKPFNYAALDSIQLVLLHSAALLSAHLTEGQRERLINVNASYNRFGAGV